MLSKSPVPIPPRILKLATSRLATRFTTTRTSSTDITNPSNSNTVARLDDTGINPITDSYNAAHALVAEDVTGWTKMTSCKAHVGAANACGG
ncbi:hypothetical protein NW754_005823 [Fusarium falciforme]|nr:hypothetical protein NW754_005823 [Fusarium falciforme]